MAVRIGVVDPLPLYRRGVAAELVAAGYAAEPVDDSLAWVGVDEPRALLFTVTTAEDWDRLRMLCAAAKHAAVIAVLDQAEPQAYARAITAGAGGVISRDAAPARLREALGAVERGECLLPLAAVRELARAGEIARETGPVPSAEERGWLSALAGGSSVGRVADGAGYSERMMFRLLRDLYGRMGVPSRTAALIRAREEGWI
jgi:DNA-binding NarL/FixJ family response regulator